MKNVEIYGRPGCDFFDETIALCNAHSIEYKHYILNEDISRRLLNTSGPYLQIFIDGKWVGGFNAFQEVVEWEYSS